ncbi:hypothetical protein C0993_011517 [Termitomyces sp. T159_Od127]|nr:hypothetical protein C0993_011517 [Termitomyces sp. T159_Od127]
MALLPAHRTKHQPLLVWPPFRLAQSDDGAANGTALWLGAQCLAAYLASLPAAPGVLLELGSGIGLTALVMSSLRWHVLATDIPPVIASVLAPNIQNNLGRLPPASGSIQVRELDWTVPPDDWTWDHPSAVASPSASLPSSDAGLLRPPFDLICTADTVYDASLVQPLLRTLHALCIASTATRTPPVYLCLERRDPALVDRCLSDARHTWGFHVQQIPRRKLAKAMHKAGMNWPREDWEGIEIWKFTL